MPEDFAYYFRLEPQDPIIGCHHRHQQNRDVVQQFLFISFTFVLAIVNNNFRRGT